MKWMIIIGVVSLLLLTGLIVAVSVALTSGNRNNNNSDSSSTESSATGGGGDGEGGTTPGQGNGGAGPGNTFAPLDPNGDAPSLDTTLGRIYNEGVLRCGVPADQPGFAYRNPDTDRMEGFDADLCRAVASAIFGPENLEYRIEFTPVTAFDRFQDLSDGKFDVLSRTTTHTMEREVLEPVSGDGFDFTIPYLYNGVQFAGVPEFVACADNATSTGACSDTKICAQDGTTH
ncbi:MAG: hypothetical protein SGARI_008028, partial [Bacillariaceae sp.]